MHTPADDVLHLQGIRHTKDCRGTKAEWTTISVGSKSNAVTLRVSVGKSRCHVCSHRFDSFLWTLWQLLCPAGNLTGKRLNNWSQVVIQHRREICIAIRR